MVIIGITGPSGSGKGAVSEYLKSADGFTIIDADRVYHDIISFPSDCVSDKLKLLTTRYESLEEVDRRDILDFHVRFERIFPFEDYNGRVGRLIMFKECLRHDVMPFILDDKRRTRYLEGLREWDNDSGILAEVVMEAQSRFDAQIQLQKLAEHRQNFLPVGFMED